MHEKFIRLLVIGSATIFLLGCSTSKPVKKSSQVAIGTSLSSTAQALGNINKKKLNDYAQKEGVVFGKTDFQGVLKAVYVKLALENLVSAQKFQLYVGISSPTENTLFDVKTVGPGYFFIKLPQGMYRISSVSIPVGSTQATEDISLEFDVLPDAATYIGTLKMIGTKEKIKLGGVPVIKPGFEYIIDIKDEHKEGQEMFHKNYPEVNKDIVVKIMRNST
jgi:hypothetical protein